MDQQRVAAAAQTLREARSARVPVAPVSQSHDISGVEEAYAIAAINTSLRIEQGARVLGKKVGLTSKAVQQQFGVAQPDFGVLLDDMEYLSGDEVPMQRLIQPKVEAEIAFVVGRDLQTSSPSYAEFLASLAYAIPAIEIVDSAIQDWKISFVDTVADNASSALYVLGDQPMAVGGVALADLGMVLTKNSQQASVGTGAACLGHPLRAAHWLARTMADRGSPLRAGEVILSGALGPMVPVTEGDVIQVRIGALGTVTCRMA
jgi:2-keto-4-pentenoate hydratase